MLFVSHNVLRLTSERWSVLFQSNCILQPSLAEVAIINIIGILVIIEQFTVVEDALPHVTNHYDYVK